MAIGFAQPPSVGREESVSVDQSSKASVRAFDLSALRSIYDELAARERGRSGHAMNYEEAQVWQEERRILNSHLNARVAGFVEQVQECVLDTQHRLLQFSYSADPHPEGVAKELLSLISYRSECLQEGLRQYQEYMLSQSPGAELQVNYDGTMETFRLTTNPALILNEVLGGLSKVSAHLAPLVRFPGGQGGATIEAYIKAKEVASDVFRALGEVLAGERGIAITVSGLRNRVSQ